MLQDTDGTPDATVVCYGVLADEALAAAELLAAEGLRIRVVKLLRIVPLPSLEVWTDAPLLFAEEAVQAGSVGERAAAALAGKSVRIGCANLGAAFPPCGVCRQALSEFCGSDMPVLILKNAREFRRTTLGELLPQSFTAEYMR